MNEKDTYDAAQIGSVEQFEHRVEARATCVSFDEHLITLSFQGLTGQWITMRRFSWSKIERLVVSQVRAAETPRAAQLYFAADAVPVTISRDMTGGAEFWRALADHGFFHPSADAHAQVGIDLSMSHPVAPSQSVAIETRGVGAEPTDTLMYPADARWIAPLVAALPDGLHVSHVRRADTVGIYLRMESIRLIFLDTLAGDALLERIREINRNRDRRIYVVGVNSTRDQERTLQLFSAGWVDRVVQLPPRARILEGLVRGAIGIPSDRTKAVMVDALAPVILITQDLLLAEDLRDVLEGYRAVLSARTDQSLPGVMKDKPLFAALIDLAATHDVIQAAAETVRRLQPGIRCYGVRKECDFKRDSYLLGQGWVQRLINAPFEMRALHALGFLPCGVD